MWRIVGCDLGCVGCLKRRKTIDKCSTPINKLPRKLLFDLRDAVLDECDKRNNKKWNDLEVFTRKGGHFKRITEAT